MKRIGELLVEAGLVTERDLEQGLRVQRDAGGLLGMTLVRLGAVSETDLLATLSAQTGLAIITPERLPEAARVRAAIEQTKASIGWLLERDAIIWFEGEGAGERLHCASRDPLSSAIQEAAEQWHREPTRFYLASQQSLESLLEELGKEHEAEAAHAVIGSDAARLKEMAEEAPVIDFVNAMFGEALQRRASDVHIEPYEERFTVRLRIDGILHLWRTAPRATFDAVASRIKLLSGMDIAERRLPQDGRQSVRIGGREVDLRVSTLPTAWGESVVLRLLGKTSRLPELEALGVAADHQKLMGELVSNVNGVVLVTGPTGSGKTTTIYRLLMQLNDGVRKIVTVEDPIEFNLPGVQQVQVRADIGLSFAAGLRSILRQDPDVILVGEIRDSETAKIAVQAALTGHLVISTVHTNSALAAVPRLLNLGVEEYLLADVLRGVVGQRLVRKLCDSCAAPTGRPGERRAVGCDACGGTGFVGRLGIYEVFSADDALRRAIHDRAAENVLSDIVRKRGDRFMSEDGMLKVTAGLTTNEEIGRVVRSV